MGQKVNPIGLRVGIRREWTGKWFAEGKAYSAGILEDVLIRRFFKKKYAEAGISSLEIERSPKKVKIAIATSRPGVIIGRQGSGVDDLVLKLEKQFKKLFEVEVVEVKKPDIDAVLVADNVARQLEKRIPFRRAAKQALQKAMEGGVKGIKVLLSGRLAGAEIARSEFFADGTVPLHTFRADIQYCEERAETTYGTIGVKVWVYLGDRFGKKFEKEETSAPEA
ncbi:MAG: 30S ribosomal protein S3 [Candidatus Peregrinibacteria bacterium]